MRKYDVVVLGAGAAGLFGAGVASQRGRSVLVLEKSNKPGKKILMSGGGRCNFTNLYVEPENFISANPHFCKSALARYTQWDFIDLVTRHGIAYEERKHGQLFCLESAKDILDMLLRECEQGGVDIETRCSVTSVRPVQATENDQCGRFTVSYETANGAESVMCASVVVATGALSIPTLGGSGLGYELAADFGLKVLSRRAGLVPFTFSDAIKPLCERLSGLAHECSVSCNGQSFLENILFTHRGMSGPAVLQVSNYWQPGQAVSIDLMPSQDAVDCLLEAKRAQAKSLLRTVLLHYMAKPLARELEAMWWAKLADRPLAEFPEKQLIEIGERMNNWVVKPAGTEGYRTAEVTLGGVDTDGISSKTMESVSHPGLFFIGEVLDVTGHLGGFNFQWAWSSGYAAGQYV